MSLLRLSLRTLALTLTIPLAATAPAVLADVPDIPDAAFKDACDAARALDACPGCSCTMITSTSPHPGGESSPVPMGVVLELSGQLEEGLAYSAIHVALGDKDQLAHVGRLAEGRTGGVGTTSYEVVARAQGFQMCPRGCDFEAVGIIHPFEVKQIVDEVARDAEATVRIAHTDLVLCYEGQGGPGANTCAVLPIAHEEVRTPFAMAPGKRAKAPTREGFERTWKFGKADEIVFGAAKGKLARTLSAPKAFKVALLDLAGHADAKALVR